MVSLMHMARGGHLFCPVDPHALWDRANMMSTLVGGGGSQLEIVVGLTGFVIIHVFIAPFPPAQGECNQMVNTKFTRPVNEMPMSSF